MKTLRNFVAGLDLLLIGGLACALFWIAPARAQSAAPGAASAQKGGTPAKPTSSEPEAQSTTATYGDWVLRCEQTGAPPQARRSCEVTQTVVIKAQSAPFAQIAFGKPTPSEAPHLTIVVPPNIVLPSAVHVAIDVKDPQPFELNWTRCAPAGCFATATPREDDSKRWRALTQSGRVTVKSASGQEVVMPISFRGFAQAIDALAKER